MEKHEVNLLEMMTEFGQLPMAKLLMKALHFHLTFVDKLRMTVQGQSVLDNLKLILSRYANMLITNLIAEAIIPHDNFGTLVG